MAREVKVLGKKRAADNEAVQLDAQLDAAIDELDKTAFDALPNANARMELLRKSLRLALRVARNLLRRKGNARQNTNG